MWGHLLDRMLGALIRVGRLEVTYPGGLERAYGEAGTPPVKVALDDPALPRRLLLTPDLALGEGYMDGALRIAQDDLHGLLGLLMRNRADRLPLAVQAPQRLLRQALRSLRQFNPARRARHNAAHHYDLSLDLYDTFLDADRQYSCAYFSNPGLSLDAAQTAKKRHIAAKLLLSPDMEVLDIGSGWGGLALTLAREHGVRVTGVTLSREQLAVARRRAADAGLSERVRFELADYREMTGRFDRIVSVGMFEHVGTPHYRAFFRTIRARLADDGVALVHSIGRMRPPGSLSPWMDKYIFPGGYAPALSEVMAAVEDEALWACDIEVWRMHYAYTLRHWYDRVLANAERIRQINDARFLRMWKFYLVASELSFRLGGHAVFQLQLSRHQTAVPLTRDYMYPSRIRHAAAE